MHMNPSAHETPNQLQLTPGAVYMLVLCFVSAEQSALHVSPGLGIHDDEHAQQEVASKDVRKDHAWDPHLVDNTSL